MNINILYDASVAEAPAGFVTAVDDAVNYLDSRFTNPVTINIALGWGEVGGQALVRSALGESEVANYYSEPYAAVMSALQAQGAPGAAALPSTSPLSGVVEMSSAQAKALGLMPANTAIDCYVGISSAFPLGLAAGVAPAAGGYYLIGVLEHELTEDMGRVSLLDDQPADYSLIDLYRYSAPGVRDLTTGGSGSTAYFSLDGGVTNLGVWNNNPANGDLADWYPGRSVPGGVDAFDAYASAGALSVVSASDVTLMNAIGWASTAAAGPDSVTAIVDSTTGGVLAAGMAVTITLDFGAAAIVSGAPTLALNDGAVATYAGGSGTTALSFTYKVGAGDTAVAALAVTGVNLNAGAIVGASGAAVSLSVAGLSQFGPQISPSSPLVEVQTLSVYEAMAAPAASAIASISNPHGDQITQYAVLDLGLDGGFLSLGGVIQANGHWVTVGAAALSSLQYLGGISAGSETLEVEVYDATLGAWSPEATLTATTLAPVKVSNTAAWVSANLDALQSQFAAGGLAAITLTDGGTPTLTIATAQLVADAGALGKIVSAYVIAASGTIGAAGAAGISAATRRRLTAGLAVSDSAADVVANLVGLQAVAAAGKLASVVLTDAATPTLAIAASQVSADAAALGKIASPFAIAASGVIGAVAAAAIPAALRARLTTGLLVSDSAADVAANLGGLQTLATAGKLAGVALTDGGIPVLVITAAQLWADKTALGAITGGFEITASGAIGAAAAVNLPTTLTARLTGPLAVSDTAASVAGRLAGLQTLASAGELGSIVLTNAATPTLTLTAAQLGADAAVLADISSPYAVSASGTSSAFNGDRVADFATPGSVLDVTDLRSKTLTATFTENAAATAGTLSLTDGTHALSVTLFGQFMAAGFSGTALSAGIVTASDGHAGTSITYNAALALPH